MNDSLKNSELNTTVDTNLLLIEIASILYQVKSIDVAQEMIFDTLSEQFAIKKMAIAVLNEMDEEYQITHQSGLSNDFQTKFRIGAFQQTNNSVVTKAAHISCSQGKVKLGHLTLDIGAEIDELVLFPISFQERMVGLLILAQSISAADEHVILHFSNLLGPVISATEPARKSVNQFENIINKIIKDRVQEARLNFNPISFSIFRLVVKERLNDSMIFKDMVRSYQTVFHDLLTSKGDLVWLTTDTVLFVFPNADLFETDQLISELDDRLNKLCSGNDSIPDFFLKYAAISYPQSSNDATEIVNKLWLKLYEEINLVE